MVHLRIVAPCDRAERALELLHKVESVSNLILLRGAAQRPEGDVILCDVAREEASVLLADLRELNIHHEGSIAVEQVDTYLSDQATEAVRHARGAPADAVLWEEVESRTSESATLSASFLVFIVLAGLIASVGIYLDSAILIVGAMVVGPEFGPIAGFCVGMVDRRPRLAGRSLLALAVGFPATIAAVIAASLVFRATGMTPDTFSEADHELANVIASPDALAFFVAFCAGAAGMLSLSTSKSAALIGVFISVTTIPAAANVGVGLTYGDASAWQGSLIQLAVNVAAILAAGTLTLTVQRLLYARRRRRHLADPAREAAGLPLGHTRRRPPAIR